MLAALKTRLLAAGEAKDDSDWGGYAQARAPDVWRAEIRHTICPRACSLTALIIITASVASIVQEDDTVVARIFIHPAADIDRCDQSSAQIRHKARLRSKLSAGFCKGFAKGRTTTCRLSVR